ncbi:hypothetical protein llg_35990 [Luteolibacter sp. LG18]|nr:hypothetical protein llg_35990 [Luteolibacter sp. LG18]
MLAEITALRSIQRMKSGKWIVTWLIALVLLALIGCVIYFGRGSFLFNNLF